MVSLEELQMQYIQEVLRRVGGNRAQAARILKIGRATLYRMLVRHDQDGERFEELTSESKAPFEALE
jgi:DNA-binding NtrC family response regulator